MNMYEEKYVVVLGASVVDIFGFCSCKYKQYDSIPGNIKMSFGGVSRNIAENMARMGINTKFISILGDDEMGKSILEHSKKIGYDMSDSLILKDSSTPTYLAILNDEGEMVSAIADMKSIDKLNADFIDSKDEVIKNAEYVFLDADNPEILEYILKKYQGDTKFVLDPISASKAEKVKHLIKYFHTIKPNRHEAEVLCGFSINNYEDLKRAGEYFISLGIKNVFISLDCDGIYYVSTCESGKIKAENVEVKNVTGAGDAFVAGIGYGYINNLKIKEIVKISITMSSITISHEDTIHPFMNLEYVLNSIGNYSWVEN
ncbi:carbohydrate kinase family protein [uncultured Clostridium sp.]|uniref:carbohydrate kinase family protein n=1 Tax=uncultured Clostridium sp. TaxID=59620 RepID=UPI0025F43570|nr:carbohydrate kinase family protein [uncultured Clostridium sp.]